MLAQHRLKQHFDENKQLKRVRTAVLTNNNKWEEQQDNKLISPQEVKLSCGIHDINTQGRIEHPRLSGVDDWNLG